MTLQQLQQSLTRHEILALTLLHENGFRTADADYDRLLIAAVIQNRVQTGHWGEDPRDTVLAPKQFSCWNPSRTDTNHLALVKRAKRWLARSHPMSHVELQALWLGAGIADGVVVDLAKGALHYHTHDATPKWSRGQEPVLVSRYHRYFAGIAF